MEIVRFFSRLSRLTIPQYRMNCSREAQELLFLMAFFWIDFQF